tara:strand:+ start:1298 stop:2206 length:909 start_codon:yes stop_codon:yes gene_type:complete
MTQSRWQEQGIHGPYKADLQKTSFLRRPLSLFLFVVFLIGAGFLIWWGYLTFIKTQHIGKIPVIHAEEGPYKVRPEDPHTHKIPHKEKTIYEHLSRQKVPGSKIKMRALPEAPVQEDPTLPTDFIQAFTDERADSETLLIPEGPQSAGSESPFGADDQKPSPFAEKEGFFKITSSDKYSESQEREASEKAYSLKGLLSENKMTCAEGLCVEGVCIEQESRNQFCLEFCQAASEDQARWLWGRLRRQVPDLLAAHKVLFRKVDHGLETGFRYHVILPRLSKDVASQLEADLSRRGIQVSRLPD